MRRLLVTALLALAGLLSLAPAGAQQPSLLRTVVAGPITPIIAAHLEDALDAAAAANHTALLVELDTPGGLDTAMRSIVQDFLTAPVPVIIYVAPAGARAASAGAVITLSAHVAAMAPGTNIGAATPINLEGGEVIDKVVNDAAAYVTAIAQERGRDTDFAGDIVRSGRSEPADVALDLGVVDVLAASTGELLTSIDGRSVRLSGDREVTLRTAGVAVVDYEMSLTRRILQALADPNLAFLFLSVGTLALIYELASPGGIIGGVLGVILLVLAFSALAVLPTNIAGILLLLVAMGLLVAELFVPGVGVFAGGGVLALLAAGVFLFQRPTGIGIDLSFLLPVPIVVGLGAVWVARLAQRTRHVPAYAGTGGELVGVRGQVRHADGVTGQAFVSGSLWRVRSTGAQLQVGEQVRVVERQGLLLLVEPEEQR